MPPSLQPAAELLLCCAHLHPTADQSSRMEELVARDIDWAVFLELASAHCLRPLVFRHLRRFAPIALPKPVYAELWSFQQQLIRRNTAMAAELVAILALLDGQGIPALPYKGPVLAATVYGDLGLRTFVDLDLLVRSADVLRAKSLLGERGYRSEYPLSPAIEASLLGSRTNYHLALVREQPEIVVELHWNTDAEFPVERELDEGWWSALSTTPFEGQDVRCFLPDELLLVLCLHGSKHFWASLGWLVDVAELIRQQPSLDWTRIISRAESMRAGRRLALGLHLLRGLLEVDLPKQVLSWLAGQPEAGVVARKIASVLLGPIGWEPSAFMRLRLNLALYETWPQRLRHTIDVVFRPGIAEWTLWSLPGSLNFLYLPLRWGRLFWKYLSTPFR